MYGMYIYFRVSVSRMFFHMWLLDQRVFGSKRRQVEGRNGGKKGAEQLDTPPKFNIAPEKLPSQ